LPNRYQSSVTEKEVFQSVSAPSMDVAYIINISIEGLNVIKLDLTRLTELVDLRNVKWNKRDQIYLIWYFDIKGMYFNSQCYCWGFYKFLGGRNGSYN
jgi:hypothetical protein